MDQNSADDVTEQFNNLLDLETTMEEGELSGDEDDIRLDTLFDDDNSMPPTPYATPTPAVTTASSPCSSSRDPIPMTCSSN